MSPYRRSFRGPFILVALVLLRGASSLAAQAGQVSIEIDPRGLIPARASAEAFSLGGGAVLAATFDPGAPFYLRASLGYSYIPTLATEPLGLAFLTAGGGLRLELGDALALRIGAQAGGFVGFYGGLVAYNPSIGLETGLEASVGGGLKLGLGGGYEYHVGELALTPAFSERAFVEGFGLKASLSFTPGAAAGQGRKPRLLIEAPEFSPVFPVFYQYYNDKPLGSVRVTNRERKAVTELVLSFHVQRYMDSPKVFARVERLEPGKSVELPILALFTDSILGVTEGTTVAATIRADYVEGGDNLSVSRDESLRVLNRNSTTWDDDRRAAAFVTANDPTVLRFSRNIAASIRGEGSPAVNERLRLGMALFHAMGLFGMDYSIDPDSSYKELSRDESALDQIQFPSQTLDFKAGDCDDLSVLYCALLEAVGVRSAFITIPGHIYAALALDMDEAEARKTFSKPEDLVFLDKEAWLPVEITLTRQEFLEAWAAGAKQWRDGQRAGTAAILPVREAWRLYPPTGFASAAIPIAIPQTTEILPGYAAQLRKFIEREIAPQVLDLRSRIASSGGSQRLTNQLGSLYARFGLYAEAEKEFLAAIKGGDYPPALVNLGTLAMLRGKPKEALSYLERARALRKDDPLVLLTIARVQYDLGEYALAGQRYREASLLAPELTRDFAYIVGTSSEVGRASAAEKRLLVTWKDE